MRRLISSFRFAFTGFWRMLATQPNAWIHSLATIAVVACGVWLQVTQGEWLALILAIGLVWIAETVNTAIETLADGLFPDWNKIAGDTKDVAAAAVLLAAITAAIVGAIVFLPRLFGWK